MTFRKSVAAFCRGFADACDPPIPAPPAVLDEQLAALPPAPGERALTKAEFNFALAAVHLRRALRPAEIFES